MSKSKNKFIIKDWTNNIMFNGVEFNSYEDAWEYIYINIPDEDNAYDDIFVEQKETI